MDEIDDKELAERVLYALLGPPARFARVFALPLNIVRDRFEMAYYHETKRQDMKMKEVAALMDVSMSKVALLSRALKENFANTEDLELTRRIEFMLWVAPLSLAKIKQVLPNATSKQISSAIKQLIAEKRVREIKKDQTTLYQLEIDVDRRVWDSWLAKIDGLNNVLRNVTDAVYARFFTDEKAAFARTLTFRIKPSQIGRLQTFYEELFALVQELDAETDGDEDAIPINLSLFWAPYDFLDRQESEDED